MTNSDFYYMRGCLLKVKRFCAAVKKAVDELEELYRSEDVDPEELERLDGIIYKFIRAAETEIVSVKDVAETKIDTLTIEAEKYLFARPSASEPRRR